MTFRQLRAQWEAAGRPACLARLNQELDYDLRSPAVRDWLTACGLWLRDPTPRWDDLPEPELLRSCFPHPETLRVADCYLDLLRLMRGDRGGLDLPQIAATHGLPPGQVADVFYELQALQPEDSRTTLDGQLCCGPLRKESVSPVSGRILLTSPEGDVVATLTVDCVQKEAGRQGEKADLWRIPALLLVPVDERWKEAEKQAVAFLEDHGLLPEGYDFRYRITLPADARWQLSLVGDSCAGQLQLLLLRACAQLKPNDVCKRFPALSRLRFDGVAATAGAILENGARAKPGDFCPVGHFFRKMMAGIKSARPAITTFIVAHNQALDSLAYERWRPPHPFLRRVMGGWTERASRRRESGYPIWKEPQTDLTIIRAASVKEALEFLHALQERPERAVKWIAFPLFVAVILLGFWLFWADATSAVQELANQIQIEEAKAPGTDAIQSALQTWASRHGYTPAEAVKVVRHWTGDNCYVIWEPPAHSRTTGFGCSRERPIDPKRLECALFLRDKMDQVDPPAQERQDEWVVRTNHLVLVRIPPGKFRMDSPKAEPLAAGNEIPRAEVVIPKPFWLGKYEVTQGQYQAVIGQTNDPSYYRGKRHSSRLHQDIDYGDLPDRPVESVTYEEALAFCRRLTELEGERLRVVLGGEYEFRLPTEAEWEYACRATTTHAFSFGDNEADLDTHAWWRARETRAVGLKFPNLAGLYDLHGNVNEMCLDLEGTRHGVRGGSFEDQDPTRFRCGKRFGWERTRRGHAFGFRVALAPKL